MNHAALTACSIIALNAAGQSHAHASSQPPPLPPIDFHPELVDGIGKWYINAPTIRGWHYCLEQLDTSDGLWKPLADGQYYGNGQAIKYFVTDGPIPSENTPGPPPVNAPTWQLRWITFRLEIQKNGLSPSFRLRRDATAYATAGNPIAVDAWDATLQEDLPALPVGTRHFLFQS